MALISSFTARRLADRKPPASKQVIIFNQGQERLAVPTDIAQKVAPAQTIYKDQKSLSLATIYEGKELHFFNLENHLTKGKSDLALDIKKGYLILFETPQKTLIAIPIPMAPLLHRINESSLVPLSLIRPVPENIETISQFAIRREDEPLIFLLDYEYLIQIATV
jgi:hypothetical protein